MYNYTTDKCIIEVIRKIDMCKIMPQTNWIIEVIWKIYWCMQNQLYKELE